MEGVMNSTALSVTEAVRNFSDYVSRVFYRRETFILRKGKKAVAELRPLPAGRRLGDLPGIMRSLPGLSPGDAEAFADDLEAARQEIASDGLRDVWES
jgi:antitoxin (DNA-binding transcriptional repressor) of toxin-antitoxin stability system